ncbi:MAG: class I SAM-dependent methyltransferase [Terriglobia bacterium]
MDGPDPACPSEDVPRALSFRDPGGAVLTAKKRVFRIVNAAGMANLQAFLASPGIIRWTGSGKVATTRTLIEAEKTDLLEDPSIAQIYAGLHGESILEHERIPFPSFPYEWAPEMLHAAARLTLDLAIDLLPEGLGLKDATPYNILFRGPRPVFIDILSLEPRDAGDAVWLAYAQFVRTFVLPLLASRYFGLTLARSLFTCRDGLEPEEVYRWLSPFQRLRPPFFSLVSLPVWLGKRHSEDDTSIYGKRILPDPEKARFILRALLEGLQRTLDSVAPKTITSTWSRYMEMSGSYNAGQFAIKERFLQQCLDEYAPKSVLDVGCNTGHFSLLAARTGARVVAIDYDPTVVGRVWCRAQAEDLDVLPMIVDLTRPTPGAGWQNREWPSFLDRARGAFDTVLMLAVVHHMCVTERVPLQQIVDLLAEVTSDLLVIEFVAPEDAMFRRLVRGREELYRGLNAAVFEDAFRQRFEIVRWQEVEGRERRLYLMRKKPGERGSMTASRSSCGEGNRQGGA